MKFVREEANSIHDFLKDWFSDDEYLQVKTSGSTGKPKAILLKKKQMINSSLATGKALNLKPKTSALLCLPIDYIAGKLMLVRALVLGWDLHYVTPCSNPLEKINSSFDFTALVPLQLQNGLHKLHLFKKIIVGGGEVSKSLEKKLQQSKTTVFATYGMTETITHIALKPINHSKTSPAFFKVLPNVKIYKDERNCLVIEAPNVADKTIFTNDVIHLISENKFEWLGRYDNVINSGGIKLHPEIIEKKLESGITNRFFLAGIPDSKLGDKLVLIIEGNPIDLDLNRFNLSKFEYPKEVFFISKFSETNSGKVQRKDTLQRLNIN